VKPKTTKRALKTWLSSHVAPPLAAGAIRFLRSTLRFRTHGREIVEDYARQGQRYVHVFWHAHILMMVYSYVGPRLVFMISRHRDGELIARTVSRFGYVPSRGSSSAGGSAALREMIRALRRDDADIGFTPDGPRGPARKVQRGTIGAARALDLPVVPIAIGCDRRWTLKTWDRFIVPKPGAHVLMAYGEPLRFSKAEDIEAGALRLEAGLNEVERFAAEHASDTNVGVPWRRFER